MQTITRTAVVSEALAARNELDIELEAALVQHKLCEEACKSVLNYQQKALWHAAVAGFHLNKARQLVAAGDWGSWLENRFCPMAGVSPATAYRYIKVATENSEVLEEVFRPEFGNREAQSENFSRVRESQPDFEALKRFKFDSIRKYALTHVPEKERPIHEGDQKFPRLASCLNLANEWSRLKKRHREKLQPIDFDQARLDLRELYDDLRWMYGDAEEGQPAPF